MERATLFFNCCASCLTLPAYSLTTCRSNRPIALIEVDYMATLQFDALLSPFDVISVHETVRVIILSSFRSAVWQIQRAAANHVVTSIFVMFRQNQAIFLDVTLRVYLFNPMNRGRNNRVPV